MSCIKLCARQRNCKCWYREPSRTLAVWVYISSENWPLCGRYPLETFSLYVLSYLPKTMYCFDSLQKGLPKQVYQWPKHRTWECFQLRVCYSVVGAVKFYPQEHSYVVNEMYGEEFYDQLRIPLTKRYPQKRHIITNFYVSDIITVLLRTNTKIKSLIVIRTVRLAKWL